MRLRRFALPLAASLLRVGCASNPSPTPTPVPAAAAPAQTETPPASPAATAEKLGGYWLLAVERGGQSIDHSLHIGLTEGILTGSLTGPDGNAREVTNVTLKADKVAWEIEGQGGSQRFEGTLKGNSSMEGTLHFVRARGGQQRGSGGGRGGGSRGGSSGDDGSGSGGSSPPPDDQGSSSGGRSGGYGGRGGRSGGRGGRSGGSDSKITWKAFKTVEPEKGTVAPPGSAGQ